MVACAFTGASRPIYGGSVRILASIFVDAGELKTLFVLGGRRPHRGWLRDFAVRNAGVIWALDRGIDYCREANIRPDLVLGDMDSVTAEGLAWAEALGARTCRHPRAKDLTDFQLALDLWRSEREGCTAPLVTGCFGGRLDHLYSTLSTFAAFEATGPRCMVDDREGVFLLYSGEEVALEFSGRPLAVSLLPISDVCNGVEISGVRWPLNDVRLTRTLPWAISNEADGDCVAVRCDEGILGVYWCFRPGRGGE